VRAQQRPQPVRQIEVECHEHAHADAEQHEQRQPGAEHAGEDGLVSDLVEPQPVGPDADDPVEQREQQEDRREHDDGHPAAPVDSRQGRTHNHGASLRTGITLSARPTPI